MDVLQQNTNTCGIAACIALVHNEKGVTRTEEELLAHDQALSQGLAADRNNASAGPEQLAFILRAEGISAKVYWPSASAPCIPTVDIPRRFPNYKNRIIVTLQYSDRQYHAVLLREVTEDSVTYMDPAVGMTIKTPINEFEKHRRCIGNPDPNELREILVAEPPSS